MKSPKVVVRSSSARVSGSRTCSRRARGDARVVRGGGRRGQRRDYRVRGPRRAPNRRRAVSLAAAVGRGAHRRIGRGAAVRRRAGRRGEKPRGRGDLRQGARPSYEETRPRSTDGARAHLIDAFERFVDPRRRRPGTGTRRSSGAADDSVAESVAAAMARRRRTRDAQPAMATPGSGSRGCASRGEETRARAGRRETRK